MAEIEQRIEQRVAVVDVDRPSANCEVLDPDQSVVALGPGDRSVIADLGQPILAERVAEGRRIVSGSAGNAVILEPSDQAVVAVVAAQDVAARIPDKHIVEVRAGEVFDRGVRVARRVPRVDLRVDQARGEAGRCLPVGRKVAPGAAFERVAAGFAFEDIIAAHTSEDFPNSIIDADDCFGAAVARDEAGEFLQRGVNRVAAAIRYRATPDMRDDAAVQRGDFTIDDIALDRRIEAERSARGIVSLEHLGLRR